MRLMVIDGMNGELAGTAFGLYTKGSLGKVDHDKVPPLGIRIMAVSIYQQ